MVDSLPKGERPFFREGKDQGGKTVTTRSLEPAGHSETERSRSKLLKCRGDRKEFLETKRNKRFPTTETTIQSARRKDLPTKANHELRELLLLSVFLKAEFSLCRFVYFPT